MCYIINISVLVVTHRGGDILAKKNTAPKKSKRQDYDEFDPSLKAVEAAESEEALLNIIIETDLSDAAIREALKRIRNEDFLFEIIIEGNLSDDLVSLALNSIRNQRDIMIRIFSLNGEKTIRLRKLAAERITDANYLQSIIKMECNKDVRKICERKLHNIA